jgi:hypothetical protein
MDQEPAGNRRHISRSVKKLLVRMSHTLRPEAVENATGISQRTVYRVRSLQRTTGDVVRHSILQGRPRVLSAVDVEVLLVYIAIVSI